MGRRFVLKSNLTAMENLWEAAQMAASVVLARRNFYGFYGPLKAELIDEVKLATVAYFLRNHVMRHKYMRVSANGHPLNFGDNVISAAWSVAHHVADDYIRQIDKKNTANVDIAEAQEYIKDGTVPLYVSSTEYRTVGRARASEKPYVRYLLVTDEYERQMDDREEMGLARIPMGEWLHNLEYDKDDELMLMFAPKEERNKIRQRIRDERKTVMRSRKRQAEYERKQAEMAGEYGSQAPDGFMFYRWRGKVYIKRIQTK